MGKALLRYIGIPALLLTAVYLSISLWRMYFPGTTKSLSEKKNGVKRRSQGTGAGLVSPYRKYFVSGKEEDELLGEYRQKRRQPSARGEQDLFSIWWGERKIRKDHVLSSMLLKMLTVGYVRTGQTGKWFELCDDLSLWVSNYKKTHRIFRFAFDIDDPLWHDTELGIFCLKAVLLNHYYAEALSIISKSPMSGARESHPVLYTIELSALNGLKRYTDSVNICDEKWIKVIRRDENRCALCAEAYSALKNYQRSRSVLLYAWRRFGKKKYWKMAAETYIAEGKPALAAEMMLQLSRMNQDAKYRGVDR